MNALPCTASRSAAQEALRLGMAEANDLAELDALEEMRGNREQVDEFLCAPGTALDISALVATFLGRGLPLRDKTRTDDALCSRYDGMRDSLTEEFDAWARKRSPMTHTSPLQRWMEIQA